MQGRDGAPDLGDGREGPAPRGNCSGPEPWPVPVLEVQVEVLGIPSFKSFPGSQALPQACGEASTPCPADPPGAPGGPHAASPAAEGGPHVPQAQLAAPRSAPTSPARPLVLPARLRAPPHTGGQLLAGGLIGRRDPGFVWRTGCEAPSPSPGPAESCGPCQATGTSWAGEAAAREGPGALLLPGTAGTAVPWQVSPWVEASCHGRRV